MATVQNIIDRAVQRSNLNDASLIPDTEAIAYISNFEQHVYMEAARENPDYFGKEGTTAARGSSTATWDLTATPGNVAAISRVEISTLVGSPTDLTVGDEVNVVSIRNPIHGITPRVYVRNRTMYEYDSELGTNSTNYVSRLKIWYSFMPSRRTATSDSLDLPDEYTALVEVSLAKLFAIRDQRPDEVQALDMEYKMHYAAFLQAVSVYDEGSIRELDDIPASSRRIGG
tara:strand:- start:1148 stop:1834 length:687 start_codon:yes stop_codon:yes gene_type:complete